MGFNVWGTGFVSCNGCVEGKGVVKAACLAFKTWQGLASLWQGFGDV